MHITLTAWAERNFDPPPSFPTLVKLAKDGAIKPQPFKIQKWFVDENAKFVGKQEAPATRKSRVDDILRAA